MRRVHEHMRVGSNGRQGVLNAGGVRDAPKALSAALIGDDGQRVLLRTIRGDKNTRFDRIDAGFGRRPYRRTGVLFRYSSGASVGRFSGRDVPIRAGSLNPPPPLPAVPPLPGVPPLPAAAASWARVVTMMRGPFSSPSSMRRRSSTWPSAPAPVVFFCLNSLENLFKS